MDFRPFECIVAGQHKVALDPARSYKFGDQRSGELDRCTSGALDNDLSDRPSVVVQVLLLSNVELKFKLLHVLAPARG